MYILRLNFIHWPMFKHKRMCIYVPKILPSAGTGSQSSLTKNAIYLRCFCPHTYTRTLPIGFFLYFIWCLLFFKCTFLECTLAAIHITYNTPSELTKNSFVFNTQQIIYIIIIILSCVCIALLQETKMDKHQQYCNINGSMECGVYICCYMANVEYICFFSIFCIRKNNKTTIIMKKNEQHRFFFVRSLSLYRCCCGF